MYKFSINRFGSGWERFTQEKSGTSIVSYSCIWFDWRVISLVEPGARPSSDLIEDSQRRAIFRWLTIWLSSRRLRIHAIASSPPVKFSDLLDVFSFCFVYMCISLTFPFVTVEDVSDLWPTVKGLFQEHLPLKRAFLTNRTRNPVLVENLPVEFILTTDARLRTRSPQEQYLFWFREPYATIVLVTCEVLVLLLSFFAVLAVFPIL